jgi:uncharacterized caspase-like protein
LDNEKRIAIVVGVNEYEAGQEQIPELKGAENDAIEIRDRLIQYGKFKISNDHYLVGRDATRRNILKAVSDIFRKDEKCDLVTFYFSGHGIPDEKTNEGYIAPYDYHPDDPFISGINMADMKKAMYNARNIASTIIILDCCNAGIVTKNTTKSANMAPLEQENKKNLFSINVESMVESSNQDQGNIVLASSDQLREVLDKGKGLKLLRFR